MKTLIIGPFPKPITGMAKANQIAAEQLGKRFRIYTINFKNSNELATTFGKFTFKKALLILKYFEFYKIFLVNCVYISIGSTFFGVLKYSPFIFLAKLSGKSLVFHSHGNYLPIEYSNLKGIKKKVFKFLINRFDKGIVLSPLLETDLTPLYPKQKTYVLYNFVDQSLQDYFNYPQKDYSTIKLVYISNLIQEKGINHLLQALLILKQQHNLDFSLTIAGHIDPSNPVEYLWQQLPNVTYAGVCKGETLWKLYQDANVFCLPTFYPMEGQPISILEAMATANAVLTTQHSGIPDICTYSNAFFVEKNSVQSIVDTLLKLHQNPQTIEQIGRYNYLNFNSRHLLTSYVNNLETILQA